MGEWENGRGGEGEIEILEGMLLTGYFEGTLY
jgi:hypothetical protein